MNFKQTLASYSLIICLLSLSLLTQVLPMFRQFQADQQEIMIQLPSFEVSNGLLHSQNESYIHQTESTLFAFDPHQDLQADDLDQITKLSSAPLGYALLNERFIVYLYGFQEEFAYDQFDDFTSESLRTGIGELINFSVFTLLMLLVSTIVVVFINFFFDFLLLSAFLYFLTKVLFFNQLKLSYKQVIKISIMSSILPILVVTVANILGLTTDFQVQLRHLFTIILFYSSLFELHKRMKRQP